MLYRDLERRHGRSLRGYIGDAVDRVGDSDVVTIS